MIDKKLQKIQPILEIDCSSAIAHIIPFILEHILDFVNIFPGISEKSSVCQIANLNSQEVA